ncbi:universal stress protein [Streptomyces sp. WMMC500]|uniref:universal stress protein n=1 Tax=Streptomyces sp. WMMC500 TaxID=3015154 RepID=UPI0032B23D24
MPQGTLRVYLGAAPGVGKTYDMLAEGHRRADRGTDVVVGFVEDYGRTLTRRMAEGLETVPRRTLTYRGSAFTEMDPDAVLARRPRLALVDELAHSNVPGSRHEKRWQDVEDFLAAGIDVISTVNIQHLESLNDVVEQITGIRQHETIPDEIVRRADQIEFVDMSAEALRRRMAHGNVYPPEKIDAALAHYFRAGNLTALREIALLWAADRVEEALLRYRRDHAIHEPWHTRERLLVALSGGPEGDTLIRRAKRIAARGAGGEFLAVHVRPGDGLAGSSPHLLADQRRLVEELGGTFHTVTGDEPARAILALAREVDATQIVVGATRRSRLKQLVRRGMDEILIEGSGDDIDVYVVTHAEAAHGRWLRRHTRTRESAPDDGSDGS